MANALKYIFWRQDRRHPYAIALILTLAAFYASTLAPDITWANNGSDGGDLITAASTGGVAHPSGYPTYLIFARIFQRLPLGTLAYRTNIMSAVFAALAALLVADMVQRGLPEDFHGQNRSHFRYWAGLIAGLGFGLSPLLWSQAVITEVYTLHTLFLASILWLIPLLGKFPRRRLAWQQRIGGLLFGLALGNQATIVFALLPWLLHGLVCSGEGARSSRLQWRFLARQLLGLLAGLCIYLTLPIRAKSGSPINWGNPVNLDGFWWLVSGRLYQNKVFSLSLDLVLSRIGYWAELMVTQFGLVGLILGLYGLVFYRSRSRYFYWTTGYIFVVYTIFSIGYNTPDSYILLIPSFLVYGLWIGLGATAFFTKAAETRRGKWLVPLGGAVFILAILINAALNYPKVDASQDLRAVDFGTDVLSDLPQDAIVVTRENEDTFILWYYHFALGQRPDIAVFNSGSLIYEWYRDRMAEIYPGVILKDHQNCYECMLADLTALNSRPICETFWNAPHPLACTP